MRTLTAAVLSMGATLAAIALVLMAPPAGAVTAVRANDFLNSISVTTQMYSGADSPVPVATALQYSGIRNIRERSKEGALAVHASTGAKTISTVQSRNFDARPLSTYMSDLDALNAAGALLAVEGPNEPNNFPVCYPDASHCSSITGKR